MYKGTQNRCRQCSSVFYLCLFKSGAVFSQSSKRVHNFQQQIILKIQM